MTTRAALGLALSIATASPLTSACASDPRPLTSPANASLALAEAADLMTGTFDSSAQAAADPDNYFNIRLVMTPLWQDADTRSAAERWLYVEQAAAGALDRPYRQRVYRLTASGHAERDITVRSEVYELPGNPLDHAGAWNRPRPLAGITPDQLVPRTGCAIELTRAPGSPNTWVGSTNEDRCISTLRGAAYATSEVTLQPGRLLAWDRGWNDQGEHVWGAIDGPYEFVRISEAAP